MRLWGSVEKNGLNHLNHVAKCVESVILCIIFTIKEIFLTQTIQLISHRTPYPGWSMVVVALRYSTAPNGNFSCHWTCSLFLDSWRWWKSKIQAMKKKSNLNLIKTLWYDLKKVVRKEILHNLIDPEYGGV